MGPSKPDPFAFFGGGASLPRSLSLPRPAGHFLSFSLYVCVARASYRIDTIGSNCLRCGLHPLLSGTLSRVSLEFSVPAAGIRARGTGFRLQFRVAGGRLGSPIHHLVNELLLELPSAFRLVVLEVNLQKVGVFYECLSKQLLHVSGPRQ